MKESLGVKNVIWDCGWGTRHCRGALQSLLSLAHHHPESVEILKGTLYIYVVLMYFTHIYNYSLSMCWYIYILQGKQLYLEEKQE